MEKFRRFDDPSCGINPFVPLKEQRRSGPSVAARSVITSIFSSFFNFPLAYWFNFVDDKTSLCNFTSFFGFICQSCQIPSNDNNHVNYTCYSWLCQY